MESDLLYNRKEEVTTVPHIVGVSVVVVVAVTVAVRVIVGEREEERVGVGVEERERVGVGVIVREEVEAVIIKVSPHNGREIEKITRRITRDRDREVLVQVSYMVSEVIRMPLIASNLLLLLIKKKKILLLDQPVYFTPEVVVEVLRVIKIIQVSSYILKDYFDCFDLFCLELSSLD